MFESIGLKRKEGITIVTIMETDTERWDSKLVEELTCFVKSVQGKNETKVLLFVRDKLETKRKDGQKSRMDLPLASMKEWELLFHEIMQLDIPTIAVITGVVTGDFFELCLYCDLRLASEYAQLGGFFENQDRLSTTRIQRISQLIGEMKTKELFFTGKIIGAEVANQIGFINRVVEEERLMAESIEIAKCMKTTPSKVIRHIKELFKIEI